MTAPLIGRRVDVEAAQSCIAQGARLLTLWGPPGVGKSRLAQALVEPLPPTGTRWVSLADAHGVEGLEAAVEPALEAVDEGWIVLDSCEHLVESDEESAALATIAGWLRARERLSLLVTSRRRLRLAAEVAVGLGPLEPDDALDLFTWTVRRSRPDFDPDQEGRSSLLRLMEALEGLPLAIELAAARWDLLGTEALLERLAQPLTVLTQPRPADPRHATLRQAIAWSWELLDPPARAALVAVATFAQDFRAADAEALVGTEALDQLEVLRDSALVQVPTPGWFQLLASVRAFAREQATDAQLEASKAAHAAWCLARHPDPERAAVRAQARADLESAARFLVERSDPRAGTALLLLGEAAPGHHVPLLDAAVAQLDDPMVRRARGRALRLQGRLDEAAADFEAGLQGASEVAVRALLLRELGVLHHVRGHLEAAEQHYEQALTAAEEAGDLRSKAVTIGNLGAIDHDLGRFERAEVRYTQALAGLRQVGDRRTEATFLANQAVLRQEQGQLPQAEAAYRGALALHEAEGDARMQAITLGNLGLLLHELGRLPQAREQHEQAWVALAEIPDRKSQALCLARLAAVEASLQDPAAAHTHLLEAASHAARSGDEGVAAVVELFGAFVDQAEGRVDEVLRRLDEAREPVRHSGDARVAMRVLQSTVNDPRSVLEYGSDWFVPPRGERADLGRHASLRRMFRALVEQRTSSSSACLTIAELFEAGWPGERIAPDSMRNRVHVNLAKLRNLGLKPILLRTEEGYALDPAVPVREA